MSRDLNKAMCSGRLGADPELRYTDDGSAVVTFRVASNRTSRDQQTGRERQDTEWFNVVAWNQLAEMCHRQLRKGMRVLVEGRIQTTRKPDGPVQYNVELIASEVIFLDGPAEAAEQPEPAAPAAGVPSPIPATPAEAERRFYARYAEQIGGGDWSTVQKYLGRRIAPPATVDEWMTAAQAVRDAGQRQQRPAARPNYSPGAAAARRRS